MKKFCSGCGHRVSEVEGATPGASSPVLRRTYVEPTYIQNNKEMNNEKSVTAFITSLITLPIMFAIALLGFEKVHDPELAKKQAWGSGTRTVLPDYVRVIMLLVLIVSTVLVVMLRKKDKPNKFIANLTVVMAFVNLFGGIILSLLD